MERRGVGLIMNDVFKDLGISLKGEKSVFNFLSDEDLKNLSTFFESKNIPAGETLWKKEDPLRLLLRKTWIDCTGANILPERVIFKSCSGMQHYWKSIDKIFVKR